MGAVLYAGNTRTGSGPLGRGPGKYLKPFDGVTRAYVGDSLRTGSAQSVWSLGGPACKYAKIPANSAMLAFVTRAQRPRNRGRT
jgi:hypothetical protein